MNNGSTSPFVKQWTSRLEGRRKVIAAIERPNLIEMQLTSYEWFLNEGLDELFKTFTPIPDYTGTLTLEFIGYHFGDKDETPFPSRPNLFDIQKPTADSDLCIEHDLTYEMPLKASARLIDKETGEVKEWTDVYLGELPCMTKNGTFIINGAERVVVSQISRSPGIYFHSKLHELTGKELFSSQVIARDGAWVELETDADDLLRVRIGNSRFFPVTTLLRAFSGLSKSRATAPIDKDVENATPATAEAIGSKIVNVLIDPTTGDAVAQHGELVTEELLDRLAATKIETIPITIETTTCSTNTQIIKLFGTEKIGSIEENVLIDPTTGEIAADEELVGSWTIDDITDSVTKAVLAKGPDIITNELIDEIKAAGSIKTIKVFSLPPYLSKTLQSDPTNDEKSALLHLHRLLRPGDPPTLDSANSLLESFFFNPRRYDLGKVGRYQINRKLHQPWEYKCKKCKKTDIKHWVEIPDAAKPADKYVQVEKCPDCDGELERLNSNEGTRYPPPKPNCTTFMLEDLIGIINYLVNLKSASTDASSNGATKPTASTDDIDHLKNKRCRCVGELLQSQLRLAFLRLERAAKERMTTSQDKDTLSPQSVISVKPITAAIRSFFASSQLSQFMQQINPLDELEHKRRLTALGPGGVTRESAKGMLQLRDVHTSHYGRLCPIQTPEGPNIGLISALTIHARLNEFGLIRTPFRKVENGRVTDEIVFLLPDEDENQVIAPGDTEVLPNGLIEAEQLVVRNQKTENTNNGHDAESANIQPGYFEVRREDVDLIDSSSMQCFSIGAGLVPFLEHDDANRALMGSNMMKQAVPLIRCEAPLVGTGLEGVAAVDSGAVVVAEVEGRVESVTAQEIVIRPRGGDKGNSDANGNSSTITYRLRPFARSNQSTCIQHRPVVKKGQRVRKGQLLADGASTDRGKLALGRNLLTAFMSWEGYNYEDAIVISEKLAREDLLTSVHIEKNELYARDTKLGEEEVTRDVPNVAEEKLRNLDEMGIIRVGAEVKPDDILVGKVSPKSQGEPSPEEKLMIAIFGKKAEDVKDSSLRMPHGEWGTVVGVNVFSRWKYQCAKCEEILHHWKKYPEGQECPRCNGKLSQLPGDQLKPQVNMMVRVYVAQKRKIMEGDKMSGRHGNKGVISKILPEADMPHLPDGTPIDLVLNPLGIPSRMNVGQVMETHLGWVASQLGVDFDCPVFEGMSGEDIFRGFHEAASSLRKDKLHEYVEAGWHTCENDDKLSISLRRPKITESYEQFLGALNEAVSELSPESLEALAEILAVPTADWKKARHPGRIQMIVDIINENVGKRLGTNEDNGKFTLYDGRTGVPFSQPIAVGYMYKMKLNHLVEDKIHARSTGPYSLVTQQPLGGKAQFGGQRLGEMEVWALEAYGAAYTLQEMLTLKSDDVHGRVKTFEALVKGQTTLEPGVPESFRILTKEVQSLGLQVTVETEDGEELELPEDPSADDDRKPTMDGGF